MLELIQRILKDAHPLSVHFPIALLVFAVALAWAGKFYKKAQDYVFLPQFFGSLALLPAVFFGWLDHRAYEGTSAEAFIDPHKLAALATTAVFGLIMLWRLKAMFIDKKDIVNSWWFVAAMTVGFILLSITGYLGGELVHNHGLITG